MACKKVMYVHGFGSSAESGTVHRLREVLPEATIIAEDVPLHPQEAIDMLRKLCEEQQPDLIVGTSMGGMYTEMLYVFDRIMINPALAIGDTMVSHGLTGQQHFFSPRKDGVQDFIVTKGLVKEYKDITKQNFLGVNDEERGRVIGLFGDLFESMYKRTVNIKDSRAIFPGMGGLLDVVDSLIFAPPVLYYFLIWF